MSAPSTAARSRATFFISYSTHNQVLADNLSQTLNKERIRCFVASEAIEPTRRWRPAIESEIRSCNVFLLLFTREAGDSREVLSEVKQALEEDKEIWWMKSPDTPVTPSFAGLNLTLRQSFRLKSGAEQACFDLIAIEARLRFPWLESGSLATVDRNNCPYLGPAHFDTNSEELFFGRSRAVAELEKALNRHYKFETPDLSVLLIHGASGAGKTSLLTVGMNKVLPQSCFYSPPIEGPDSCTLLQILLNRLNGNDPATLLDPKNDLISEIASAMRGTNFNRYVFCFDQMEILIRKPPEFENHLRALQRLSGARVASVTVLISFRKEYLAEAQQKAKSYFPDRWFDLMVHKLSPDEAWECIVRPAASRDISFDPELADAFIDALVKDAHSGEPTVDPMDIQKVCKELWDEAAALNRQFGRVDGNTLAAVLLDRETRKQIHSSTELALWDKPEGKKLDLRDDAKHFAEDVLKSYIPKTIERIKAALSTRITDQSKELFVMLALQGFVGPAEVRQRVKVDPSKPGREMNQDLSTVLEKLTDAGIVQRCGEGTYELVHDTLALEIGTYGETQKPVAALKNFRATYEREMRLSRGVGDLKSKHTVGPRFNAHSELVSDLESVRDAYHEFSLDELNFLVRSALGDGRRSVRGDQIDLAAWIKMLKGDPAVLTHIFKDALPYEKDSSVQLDALNQLHDSKIVSILTDAREIGDLLSGLCLESKDGEVRARASSALTFLGYEPGLLRLFEYLGDNEVKARKAIALVKHAVQVSNRSTGLFRASWQRLKRLQRYQILLSLSLWRWKRSYGFIFSIMALTAPVTALGALMPFAFFGLIGASLTMAADIGIGGMAKGVFHGASGGLIWAIGVTSAVLSYCVIWKGGRIRQSDAPALAFWTAMGGFFGGLVNTLVVTLVFLPQALFLAGWLLSPNPTPPERLDQVFTVTRYGWILPIFGATLGWGIGWSLATILGDAKETWMREKKFDGRKLGQLPEPQSSGTDGPQKMLWRIIRHVFGQAPWNIFWIAIGTICVYLIIRSGPGACETSPLPEGCVGRMLTAKWLRAVALGFVILAGSLTQEISFLLGVFRVQFGIEPKKNEGFLRSADYETLLV